MGFSVVVAITSCEDMWIPYNQFVAIENGSRTVGTAFYSHLGF